MENVRQLVTRGVMATLLILSIFSISSYVPCLAQEGSARRVKTKIAPAYPEVARRMGISGTVRLTVVVAPNGNVKTATAIGGHPLLINAAMDAVKQWKYETAGNESSGTVEVKFSAQEN